MAKLYLVPNMLSDSNWQDVLPAQVHTILSTTKYYIVENIRTARRFLKKVNKEIDINALTFFELNKFTKESQLSGFLKPIEQGFDVAVISEAGCPGVADPGADIVKLAHLKGIPVLPVVGPSSIILALMASGLNGQNFTFNRYLPVKQHKRTHVIAKLEKIAHNRNQTQIFIETPYRNNQMIKDLFQTCSSSTLICIAANLTSVDEFIATKTVGEWKNKVPDLNKQPAIFLIGN